LIVLMVAEFLLFSAFCVLCLLLLMIAIVSDLLSRVIGAKHQEQSQAYRLDP